MRLRTIKQGNILIETKYITKILQTVLRLTLNKQINYFVDPQTE